MTLAKTDMPARSGFRALRSAEVSPGLARAFLICWAAACFSASSIFQPHAPLEWFILVFGAALVTVYPFTIIDSHEKAMRARAEARKLLPVQIDLHRATLERDLAAALHRDARGHVIADRRQEVAAAFLKKLGIPEELISSKAALCRIKLALEGREPARRGMAEQASQPGPVQPVRPIRPSACRTRAPNLFRAPR